MPPALPAGAPAWAVTLYWTIIVVVLALGVSIPLAVKAYTSIHADLKRLRDSNHKLVSASTATNIGVQAVAKKVDAVHAQVNGGGAAKPPLPPQAVVLPLEAVQAPEQAQASEAAPGEFHG